MKRREFLKGAVGTGLLSIIPIYAPNVVREAEATTEDKSGEGTLRETTTYNIEWNREEVRLEVMTKDVWLDVTFTKYPYETKKEQYRNRQIALGNLIKSLKIRRIQPRQLLQLSAPEILSDHCTFHDLTY